MREAYLLCSRRERMNRDLTISNPRPEAVCAPFMREVVRFFLWASRNAAPSPGALSALSAATKGEAS